MGSEGNGRIGVAGQNVTTPAEKIFGNHQFVQYFKQNGASYIWYDPSYGKTYNSVGLNFEGDFVGDCIDGFAEVDNANTNVNTVILKVLKP